MPSVSSYEEEKSSSSSSLVANLEIIIPSVYMDYASKCPSINGFVACGNNLSEFIICNPATKQVVTSPIFGPRACLGYDPVGRQFKVFNMVTSPYQPSIRSHVHEVITLGGGGGRNRFTTALYDPITKGLCINGFLYYGAYAPRARMDPVIVCFDVRSETLSCFIKAPRDVVFYEDDAILIEYNGK